MATEVTIQPTLGNPVLFTQGGVFDIDNGGAGGDAIDLRRVVEASGAGQEGVLDSGGWKVTATNGDMTVDVAAEVGLAVVQGDDVTAQGRYTVAPHNAAVTLDIPAASASAPRLDQIVLHVRDDEHDGSGENDARVMVLQGTATAGATLTNRTGHATLPDTCLLLADVLVSASATQVTTANVRDRRRWAYGGGFSKTLSGSLGTGNITNLGTRLECSGAPLLCTFASMATAPNTGGQVALHVDVGGTDTTLLDVFQAYTAGATGSLGASVVIPTSAGSKTIYPAITSISGGGSASDGYFAVRELVNHHGTAGGNA